MTNPFTQMPQPPAGGLLVLNARELKRTITVLEFRSRFTDSEKIAITTAAESSVPIRVWMDDLASAQDVNLDDPRIVAGVHAMEYGGLIGAGRAAEILA